MSLYELSTELENMKEETTMSNITFLPTHLGTVKAAIATLSKFKLDWNIEILENDDNREVRFEDALIVTVPNEHWDAFLRIFDKKELSNNNFLNLRTILKEAMEDEVRELLLSLKPELIRAFTNPPFDDLEKDANNWRARFGVVGLRRQDVVVSYGSKKVDLKKLYMSLGKVYKNDKGNLEMLIDAFKNKEPLSTFVVFKKHDYLYGAKIHSRFRGVNLVFEATIDMSFTTSETVYVSSIEVIDDVEADIGSVKVVGNVIYPKGMRFEGNFYRRLKDAIEDNI